MKMEEYAGYQYIEGGVCAAQGFTANGLNCGLNPDKAKNDLGMVYSERLCTAAAVYTTNKVKGAPVLVTKRHLGMSGGRAKAVIVNSKNANTCNADGVEIAEKISELAAQALEIRPEEVIIASTGVIGQPLSPEPFAAHMQELAAGLSREGHTAAAAGSGCGISDCGPKMPVGRYGKGKRNDSSQYGHHPEFYYNGCGCQHGNAADSIERHCGNHL